MFRNVLLNEACDPRTHMFKKIAAVAAVTLLLVACSQGTGNDAGSGPGSPGGSGSRLPLIHI